MPEQQDLPLWKLFTDGNPCSGPRAIRGFQFRDATDPELVAEYTAARLRGDVFPPIVVYFDGAVWWVAGGYHRILAEAAAAKAEGKDPRKRTIRAEVRSGSERQARLAAAGENQKHGRQRTNIDKRNAVTALLEDPEWSAWPDPKIAKHCGVSHWLVGEMRKERTWTPPPEAAVNRDAQRSAGNGPKKRFKDMSPQEQAAAQDVCPRCGQTLPPEK